jgi:hypothetical protein
MKNNPLSRTVMFPFRLQIDPMERLLVISIKGNPEFSGIEPQVFDDAINGKGMRIIRYRKDGKVDVYWQPGVKVDRNKFVIGKGTSDFVETEISPSLFEITPQGINLDIAFTDLQGRKNELKIREFATNKKAFPLLAPISADIENPIQFNVVYMPDFDFVRRAGTFVDGKIGDSAIQLDSIPLLLGGHRVWLARYGVNPVIGILNPPMDHPTIVDIPDTGNIEIDGMKITADHNGSLTSMSAGEEPSSVKVEFSPGFPNLKDFSESTSSSGRWSFHAAGAQITGGTYALVKRGESIEVELDVLENWKPANLPLPITILTSVVRMFRTWPSTYRWKGVINPGEKPSMTGKWERVRRH